MMRARRQIDYGPNNLYKIAGDVMLEKPPTLVLIKKIEKEINIHKSKAQKGIAKRCDFMLSQKCRGSIKVRRNALGF